MHVEKPTPTAKLNLGYKSPALGDPDHLALSVLGELLFGGRSSRLVKKLIREREVATDVRVFVSPFIDAGLFEVFANARAGVSAEAVFEVIDAELARVVAEGVSEEELDRAKARIELGLLQGLSTAEGKASTVGFYEVVLGDPVAAFKRVAELEKVTLSELHAVARRYLDENLGARSSWPGRNKAWQHEARQLRQGSSNEPNLLVERDAALPLVHLGVSTFSGSAYDPPGLEGLTRIAGRLMRRTAGGRSRGRRRRARGPHGRLDGRGVRHEQRDALGLVFEALARHLRSTGERHLRGPRPARGRARASEARNVGRAHGALGQRSPAGAALVPAQRLSEIILLRAAWSVPKPAWAASASRTSGASSSAQLVRGNMIFSFAGDIDPDVAAQSAQSLNDALPAGGALPDPVPEPAARRGPPPGVRGQAGPHTDANLDRRHRQPPARHRPFPRCSSQIRCLAARSPRA